MNRNQWQSGVFYAITAAILIAIALTIGEKFPNLLAVGAIGLVGFFGYGISLVLFVIDTKLSNTNIGIIPISTGASKAILGFDAPVDRQNPKLLSYSYSYYKT